MATTGTSDPGRLLANAKKRRGVARALITRLTNRLRDLEADVGANKTLEIARRMSQNHSDVDSEFRTYHHAIVDDEETSCLYSQYA